MHTRSSSMLVWHFSRFIRLIATFSFLGAQYAAWTTAVAPLPEDKYINEQINNQIKHDISNFHLIYRERTTLLLFPSSTTDTGKHSKMWGVSKSKSLSPIMELPMSPTGGSSSLRPSARIRWHRPTLPCPSPLNTTKCPRNNSTDKHRMTERHKMVGWLGTSGCQESTSVVHGAVLSSPIHPWWPQ